MIIKEKIKNLINECETQLKDLFEKADEIALKNQRKVLDAFINNRISTHHFNFSTGYGYGDSAKEALNRLFSDVFHTEDAIVSPMIANGTHAISLALYGVLRPNDILLSVCGKPYDTLVEVINGVGCGSLRDFGVKYHQINYRNGAFNLDEISKYVKEFKPKAVFLQRSKGYHWQKSILNRDIKEVADIIKSIHSDCIIICDNCYGEFVEELEPTDVGADIIAGSLIKNPGGGCAPTGGYIAGKTKYIELIAKRLTTPSLGNEVGSYYSGYLPYFQGFFIAPSVVRNAIKGCLLASKVFSSLGYESLPAHEELPGDIICAVKLKSKEQLLDFCRATQKISPIDSHVTPYPCLMPGYKNDVIMAAGAFIQGSSIELTADAPIKEPYIAYLQGGLTYEHVKIALEKLVECLI